jgi:hypothetical protein
MFHQISRWVKNAGFTLKTMWRARKRRLPIEQRPGAPVTFYPPHEIEQYFGGVTCSEAACARPKPAKDHADQHLGIGDTHSNAQANLFRLVNSLQRARARKSN